MKKQLFLFASCLALATMSLSFKSNQPVHKTAAVKMLNGVPVGTLHWVIPEDSALYQDFIVYVDVNDNSQVVGLKLVGTSTVYSATGTYDGTNVYNVFCTFYGAEDIGGEVL